MAELPRGTVTLVFTDIEGSTRLLASLGSCYEEIHAAFMNGAAQLDVSVRRTSAVTLDMALEPQ